MGSAKIGATHKTNNIHWRLEFQKNLSSGEKLEI